MKPVAVLASALSLAACAAPAQTPDPAPAATAGPVRAGAGGWPAAPRVPPTGPERTASDLIRPSAHPITLRDAPRGLSVRYTYDGHRYTLDDFLTRTKTVGFVVLDGQDIVYERYADADRHTRFQSWSVAKSITSAAIGIALEEGRIRSIDAPVTEYLPELRHSGYDGVSIRNLLRMSSGIEWNEEGDLPFMFVAPQREPLWKTAARQRRGWAPGSGFLYTSMNSFVLARLITRTTGMPYHRYVERRLWQPAGMESTAYLAHDSSGDGLGYCCHYATARDFARFGLLYLRGGKAQGRQVVPGSWVRRSTTRAAPFRADYGLHWWLGDGTEEDFLAIGLGGQYVYVSPRHGVVIARLTHSARELTDKEDREELLALRAVAVEVARTRPQPSEHPGRRSGPRHGP